MRVILGGVCLLANNITMIQTYPALVWYGVASTRSWTGPEGRVLPVSTISIPLLPDAYVIGSFQHLGIQVTNQKKERKNPISLFFCNLGLE